MSGKLSLVVNKVVYIILTVSLTRDRLGNRHAMSINKDTKIRLY